MQLNYFSNEYLKPILLSPRKQQKLQSMHLHQINSRDQVQALIMQAINALCGKDLAIATMQTSIAMYCTVNG